MFKVSPSNLSIKVAIHHLRKKMAVLQEWSLQDHHENSYVTLNFYILGEMEPTTLVPSGFSASTHHFTPSGSEEGAMV